MKSVAVFVSTLLLFVASTEIVAQDSIKSLVIVIDGMGYGTNGLDVASTPNIDALRNGTWQAGYHGAFSDNAFSGGVLSTATQQPTISGPGWSTIQTGVWFNQHGVSGNGTAFTNGNFTDNPPYIGIVKSNDNSLVTVSFVNWSPIDGVLMHAVDTDPDPNNNLDFRGDYSNDLQVAQAAANTITGGLDPDVLFVAFDQVDGAGHSFGGSSIQYQQQIETSDTFVGMILDQVAARSNFANEDWQIIITSDHGHIPPGGHGGQSVLERRIPFIVSSKNIQSGELSEGVSQADVAPTVLDHFNMNIPNHYWGQSRADGAVDAPIEPNQHVVIAIDDFEGLPLQPFSVASGGDGTDWTNQIGSGSSQWTIDNTGMSGTTSEQAYLGWTAMDVNSWINEQGVQIGRSIFAIPANNTALVADPDAWADFTTGAQALGFNSYIRRNYELSGLNLETLTIEYDYEFATEASQHGTVEISFDGGDNWQTLQQFDSAALADNVVFAGQSSFRAGIDFNVDSKTLSIRFGCIEAGNNWWFAIDNVSLSIDLILGDVNGDGFVNLLDVQPFVDALSTGIYVAAADINQDGSFDLLDVSLFVQILSGN